jgi:hypothetical protein
MQERFAKPFTLGDIWTFAVNWSMGKTFAIGNYKKVSTIVHYSSHVTPSTGCQLRCFWRGNLG